MKIQSDTVNLSGEAQKSKGLEKVGKSETPKKTNTAKEANPTDFKTDISTQAKQKAAQIADIKKEASSAPEIREEKVASLQQQIAAGTYKPNPEQIASKLLDEHASTAFLG